MHAESFVVNSGGTWLLETVLIYRLWFVCKPSEKSMLIFSFLQRALMVGFMVLYCLELVGTMFHFDSCVHSARSVASGITLQEA